jgi:hypothetical protein
MRLAERSGLRLGARSTIQRGCGKPDHKPGLRAAMFSPGSPIRWRPAAWYDLSRHRLGHRPGMIEHDDDAPAGKHLLSGDFAINRKDFQLAPRLFTRPKALARRSQPRRRQIAGHSDEEAVLWVRKPARRDVSENDRRKATGRSGVRKLVGAMWFCSEISMFWAFNPSADIPAKRARRVPTKDTAVATDKVKALLRCFRPVVRARSAGSWPGIVRARAMRGTLM